MQKDVKIPGYKLYSLGAYPAIVETGNPKDIVVCDILSSDSDDYKSINRMELGAGYKEKKVVIDNKECSLYTYNDLSFRDKPVPDGDWNKYLNNKN